MHQFSLNGAEIVFSPKASAYRDCFVKYAGVGSHRAAVFIEAFDREKQLRDLVGLMVRETRAAIQATVENVISDLISYGIYDIDEAAILPPLRERIDGSDAIKLLSEVFEALPDDEDYSSSGLSLIGGGFGVEGALKGAAIATAASLATGIMSSAVANARRARDEHRTVVGIRSAQTKRRFAAALKSIVLLGTDLLSEVLQEREIDAFDFPNAEDRRKAEAMVRNVANNRLPEVAEEGALVTAIKLNPYQVAPFVLLKGKNHWNDQLASLVKYLDINIEEAAGSLSSDKVMSSAASQVSSLESGIRNIIEKHTFNDLMLDPNIPANKHRNATEKYFNNRTPGPPEYPHAKRCDPGKMIALIDATAFKNASLGIAFGTEGLAWKSEDGDPALLSWDTFHHARHTLRLAFFGVGLAGGKLSVAGSDVKRDALLEIMTEIGELLEQRL